MKRIVCLTLVAMALALSPAVAQMTSEEEKALDTNTGVPLAAPEDTEVYSGTNAGGPLWDRPLSLPPTCSISGLGPVNYSDQPFFVDAAGTCDITSVQDYDGYLHVYEVSWDPLDQCTNLIALDDDGAGGIGTSDILGLPVNSGVVYWIVTSAFSAGQTGVFTNTVDCDVDVTLGQPVPVMGSRWLALMALVLLAGGLLVTRIRF